MTPLALLNELGRWRDAGWLRSLDAAFARFIHEMDVEAPASLLLAAALVAQMEGRGHSGLPLAELATDPNAILGWPPEGAQAVRDTWVQWPGELDGGWSEEGAKAPLAWRSRPVLEIDPSDDAGTSPLVLSGGLLYLRRYWRFECRVAMQIHARTIKGSVPADELPGVDPSTARELLDRLFGMTASAGETDWQKVACALALRGRLTIITGGPGTGKTYTAARLLVLLQALHHGPQPLRVALAAPTGKAAARLRQSIQKALQGLREQVGGAVPIAAWADQLESARTLHSLLGTQPGTRRFRHDAANPLEVDVLFVDEASMVHLEMMAQLLEALPMGARVILLGDKDQLASVEAGAVMGDLCQGSADGHIAGGYRPEVADWIRQVTGHPLPPTSLGTGSALAQQTVVLRKSHRFDGPIGQLAQAVNRGEASAALQMARSRVDGPASMLVVPDAAALLPVVVNGRAGALGGYRTYLERLSGRPAEASAFPDWARHVLGGFDCFRVLCAVREGPWGVQGLNVGIERALSEAGLLTRRGEWYEGRPVIVTRNDPALGVFNGDIGVVLRSPVADALLRCYFLDGDELRSVSVNRLPDVETAFAMTVHKSQGSEFDHVLLVLPDRDVPVLTRELIYTGITRASKAFTLASKHPKQLVTAAGRLTRRIGGLRGRLGAKVDGNSCA